MYQQHGGRRSTLVVRVQQPCDEAHTRLGIEHSLTRKDEGGHALAPGAENRKA